jgi:peptide-methionine (R)-S-oxide reductase
MRAATLLCLSLTSLSTAFRSSIRMATSSSIPTSNEGWRTQLNPAQFRILREKGTEPSGFSERTGELEDTLKKSVGTKYPKEGTFTCVGCGSPLYYAKTKFDSGCGWPAFYQGVEGAIKEVADADGRRIEILCNNCGGHLGHVFKNEGFPNPTNERHCVNGICLKYEPAK